MDCVNKEMFIRWINAKMTADKVEWKKRHAVATPPSGIKEGQEEDPQKRNMVGHQQNSI